MNDAIVAVVCQLIDDSTAKRAGGDYREPTHSDIEFLVNKFGLAALDPKQQGQQPGKAKRVRAILHETMAGNEDAGPLLIHAILAKVRACGGFRKGSENYVGDEAIANAKSVFNSEGYWLADDGTFGAKVLDGLKGSELTAALHAYAIRAQRGSEDAALLMGTGKDLMEATAAHVLTMIAGRYPVGANFKALLGMAFTSLGLAVPEQAAELGEPPAKELERGLFTAACGANKLRNKEGTGHGRPWMVSVDAAEAKAAIEIAGSVSAYLLDKLQARAR
ncbi:MULTISPECIES: abortive infection family protein [unclassified Paraburkholderia]|uniref:abortive infection family protein n=1 Tax=unclassified Paraburkholderia TaxID=2615204 RepID=UPI002AB22122|nr:MULTISPECIES: abortive infection family protein [unclassified Paraburkholderia]